ncbi:hypothetical protein PIB30_057676 [Stylosanthes scabra]|uniref:RNase H type-1 domain-containing protein n=1 Tax=Stylosanthes scabra TaxID=79078 RepID=A0ABU6SKN2_9FABA|nr:hypothetical protein [Stylosanthes scabra]
MDHEAISKLPFSHQPVRSVSFPSRTHPSSQRIESLFTHLKPHSGFDAETIQNGLVVLAELYNCMEELFQSTQTQQALLHHQEGKLVEEALSGSVTLLDACGSARDLLLALREQVHSLQSAIRRTRRGDSSIVESSVSAYECFRKKAKKEITKQLGLLKKMENNNNKDSSISSLLGQDQNLVFFARVLRESRTITNSIFCSLLLFMSMPALGTKGSSLISKLKPKRLLFSSSNKNSDGVVADLNTALCSLLGRDKNGGDSIKSDAEGALRVLETLNADIDGLEGGLNSMFRCLVVMISLFGMSLGVLLVISVWSHIDPSMTTEVGDVDFSFWLKRCLNIYGLIVPAVLWWIWRSRCQEIFHPDEAWSDLKVARLSQSLSNDIVSITQEVFQKLQHIFSSYLLGDVDLFSKIQDLLRRNWNVRFELIKRETNNAADWLAKKGALVCVDYALWTSPEDNLHRILCIDAAGLG